MVQRVCHYTKKRGIHENSSYTSENGADNFLKLRSQIVELKHTCRATLYAGCKYSVVKLTMPILVK